MGGGQQGGGGGGLLGGLLAGIGGQQGGGIPGAIGQAIGQRNPLLALLAQYLGSQQQQAPLQAIAQQTQPQPPLMAAQGPPPGQLAPAVQAGMTSMMTPPPLQAAQGGGAGPGIQSILAGLNQQQPQSMLGPPQQPQVNPAGSQLLPSDPHNFLHIGSIIGAVLGAL